LTTADRAAAAAETAADAAASVAAVVVETAADAVASVAAADVAAIVPDRDVAPVVIATVDPAVAAAVAMAARIAIATGAPCWEANPMTADRAHAAARAAHPAEETRRIAGSWEAAARGASLTPETHPGATRGGFRTCPSFSVTPTRSIRAGGR
jgi:hypothetical protein